MTMEVERVGLDEWADALPADGFEVFHVPEAIAVLAEHAPGELELLAGYKGDRPVGLLPVVVNRRAVGKTVLSPPPGMGIPQLGPLLMPASPKRRKREQLNRRFVGAVVERFDVGRTGTLFRAVCPQSYADPRPFSWEGLAVEPSFTYRLDTAGRPTEDILGAFSKSLRREVRAGRDLDLSVSVEGIDAARKIHAATRDRYEEQGQSYPLEWAYVRDLVEAMEAVDRCRVYVARGPDGGFLGGMTVLSSNDAAYFWQGGTRESYENVSVNSQLHWRVIKDLVADPPAGSPTRYDLMGANTERLCRYKAKFSAALEPYYVVESRGTSMAAAKRLYDVLHRK